MVRRCTVEKKLQEAFLNSLPSESSLGISIFTHFKGPHRRSGRCVRFCSDSDICVSHTRTVSFQLFQVAVAYRADVVSPLSDAEISEMLSDIGCKSDDTDIDVQISAA